VNDVDVAVIGGGISGLATAWYLARAGLSVEVWERNQRPGGLINSQAGDGYITERAASMVLNYLPEVSEFLAQSGLDHQITVCPPATRRYLYSDGRLHEVAMTIAGLFHSPLWSWRGKARLCLEPFLPRGGHAEETVSEFISRRLGSELLEKAIEPFVGATLSSNPDMANARATLPRLTALEAKFGSIGFGVLAKKLSRKNTTVKSSTFSFQGGMSALINALAQRPGIRLRTSRRVTEIEKCRKGWLITANTPEGQQVINARAVVLSTPSKAAASLVAPIDREMALTLGGIAYAPLAVVHLGFDRASIGHALDGNGFLIPRRERMPINGCLMMSSLFPDRAPPGKALLTAYVGGARNPGAITWDGQRMVSETVRALAQPLSLRGEPEMARIDRHPVGLPLYYGAYPARLQTIEKRLRKHPGLYLEANYRGGVSVRDRIARAGLAAGKIATFLQQPALATARVPLSQRPTGAEKVVESPLLAPGG